MKRVFWTDPAISDLNGIHEYISRDSEIYANSVLSDLFDSVDRLILYLESGRMVPELNDDTIREIIVGSYRIMYDMENDLIQILTVLHAAKLFPNN
jgi:toxin ParE1/3/4